MKVNLDVYLDKEVPVKFWKSSESGVQTPDLDWSRQICVHECSCWILQHSAVTQCSENKIAKYKVQK